MNDEISEPQMSNALFILLCSGEHEKIQMAGMMASVAACPNARSKSLSA